MIFIEMAISL